MRFCLIIFSVFFSLQVLGQNHEMEWEYKSKKDYVKSNNIKSIIIKNYRHPFDNNCLTENYKIITNFLFNENGQLIRYSKNPTYFKTKSFLEYQYLDDNDYSNKKKIFYDSTGNIKNEYYWKIERNSLGLIVTEKYYQDTVIIRSNIFKYDDKHNIIEQYSEFIYPVDMKWKYKYDDKNRLIKREEWNIYKDTSYHYSSIIYKYGNNDKLIEKKTVSPNNKFWNTRQIEKFIYDQNNKLCRTEKTRIFQTISYSKETLKDTSLISSNYDTQFEYNEDGLLICIREYRTKTKKLMSCEMFEYEFYKKE